MLDSIHSGMMKSSVCQQLTNAVPEGRAYIHICHFSFIAKIVKYFVTVLRFGTSKIIINE